MKNVILLSLFFLFTVSLFGQTAAVEDLRVFPNPVVDQFEVGSSERVGSIRVVNMVGREVRKFDTSAQTTFDIADLPQGMYLVQLRDHEDKVIHTQRVKKG